MLSKLLCVVVALTFAASVSAQSAQRNSHLFPPPPTQEVLVSLSKTRSIILKTPYYKRALLFRSKSHPGMYEIRQYLHHWPKPMPRYINAAWKGTVDRPPTKPSQLRSDY